MDYLRVSQPASLASYSGQSRRGQGDAFDYADVSSRHKAREASRSAEAGGFASILAGLIDR